MNFVWDCTFFDTQMNKIVSEKKHISQQKKKKIHHKVSQFDEKFHNFKFCRIYFIHCAKLCHKCFLIIIVANFIHGCGWSYHHNVVNDDHNIVSMLWSTSWLNWSKWMWQSKLWLLLNTYSTCVYCITSEQDLEHSQISSPNVNNKHSLTLSPFFLSSDWRW